MADLIVASEEVTETSELQAVTTASTATTPQAAALLAAGSSASQPHAAVTYQQVDLDQYIQARVQSQLSGMLQQQGMGGPWIPYNGQYPVYYSPGPSQGGLGVGGTNQFVSAAPSGGRKRKPTASKAAAQSDVPLPGKRPKRGKGAAVTKRTLFPAVTTAAAARSDDDAVSIYASGNDFSQSGGSSEEDDSDSQMATQTASESSDDEVPPQTGATAPGASVRGRGWC